MKRIFLLLCVICALYGLSWANNFGSSVEGEQAAVTFTHTADCDSARAEFGYDGDGGADTLNFYVDLGLMPCFSASGRLLMGEGLSLDSIGTHIVKITYFEDDGNAVADGYVAGIWTHKDPTPGDTIQRDASTLTASDVNAECDQAFTDYDPPTRTEATVDKDAIITVVNAKDDNPWDNAKSDTASGMGGWFADWFNANYWLTATGFSTVGDQMDLTGGAETKVRNQCANANSDSGWTATRAGRIDDFVYFWGACDSCYARYFPEDGTANKDSAYLINPKLVESDTLTAKVVFRHSNVLSVADSSYFYLKPWW